MGSFTINLEVMSMVGAKHVDGGMEYKEWIYPHWKLFTLKKVARLIK